MEGFFLPLPSSGGGWTEATLQMTGPNLWHSPKIFKTVPPFSPQPGVLFVAHPNPMTHFWGVFVASPKAKTTPSGTTFQIILLPASKWAFNLPQRTTLAPKTYGLGEEGKNTTSFKAQTDFLC